MNSHFSPPAPPVRQRARPKPYTPKKPSLPRALQMEIINLSSDRFIVSMDQSRPMDKDGMSVSCKYSKCDTASRFHGNPCTISKVNLSQYEIYFPSYFFYTWRRIENPTGQATDYFTVISFWFIIRRFISKFNFLNLLRIISKLS